jgi:hypothetical protein
VGCQNEGRTRKNKRAIIEHFIVTIYI